MSTALLRIARRNVRKNWRHSLGAALAVAVGFAAIALFDGYIDDLQRVADERMEEEFMMGTVVVERIGAVQAMATWEMASVHLREAEQAFVDAFLRAHADEVAVRVRSLFLQGLASNGRSTTPFVGWGYDPAEGAAMRRRFAWNAWYGRPLQEAGPDAVQLGLGLASLLECRPRPGESPVGPDGRLVPRERPFDCVRPRVQLMGNTVSGQVNAVQPLVAGILDGGRTEINTQLVMMPLDVAQRLQATRAISQYNVLLRDPSTAARFSRELEAEARARGLPLEAIPWQRCYHGIPIAQAMKIVGTFRALMAAVVVSLAGMAIFTTMVKAVNERTREVGTLRSLGFVRGQVTRLFALEAALLSGAACAAGLAATLALSAAVNAAGLTYDNGVNAVPLPLGVAIHPLRHLAIAAFLVGVAVLAAWLPARRAARRSIPDALAWA